MLTAAKPCLVAMSSRCQSDEVSSLPLSNLNLKPLLCLRGLTGTEHPEIIALDSLCTSCSRSPIVETVGDGLGSITVERGN